MNIAIAACITSDYAGSRQAPLRMVKLNDQLKAALADAGLLKE